MLANSSPTLEKCYPNISYRIAARIIINPLEPVKVIKQENNMGNTDAFITELKALLKKYNMCDENEHNEHKICIIGTSYIPPYDNPTGIQFPYPPRESYNFAIHRSNGRKYVGGSVGPSCGLPWPCETAEYFMLPNAENSKNHARGQTT
jgi:hypothetical protein